MRLKSTFSIGASVISLLAAPAWANDAAAVAGEVQSSAPDSASADKEEADTAEAIIVTGSRLPSSFNAPTPLTVVSGEELRASSPASVAEALAQLPAFSGSLLTSNLGRASSLVGAGQSLLNLRGLGSNRTLVLLDGERLPASNLAGSVDINVIPQVLVKRVDVVTGGASSSYGSDAVAGVVNFIIDSKFTGLKLDLSAGQTVYNDLRNYRAQAAFGTSFADGRGRFVASADYFHLTGIGLGPTGRDWFDFGPGFSTLPAGSVTTFGVIPDPRLSTLAFGGLVDQVTSPTGASINVAGLSNNYFAAPGVLQPFDFGTNRGPSFQTGGSGPRAAQGISPSQRRISAFGHAEFDLTDNLTAFAGALYSSSRNSGENFYAFEQGARGFRIYADNAYLTPALRTLMTANNVASFRIGRLTREIPWLNVSETEILRFNGGLRGQLFKGWDFDTSLAYARSKQDFGQNQAIVRNLYAAADAVRDLNGNIVCRSTLAGLDPSCVPINVLGPDTISEAGKSYVSGFVYGYTTVKQLTASFNVRGDLGDDVQLGAGPISLAFGAAYRDDDTVRTVSPLSNIFTSCTGLRATGCAAFNGQFGGYAAYNPAPLVGEVKVLEGYGELGIPLLKDLPLIESLDLNLALRATDYSTSGTVYTWKIGPSWQVTDDLRLRMTRSRDIRAPSAEELFATISRTGSVTNLLYPNSSAPGPLQTTTIAVTTGNSNLQPEVANTLTVGGVYSPSWLPGLQLSADYYSIDIKGAIAAVANQAIIDGCFAGDQGFCSLITAGGAAVTSTALLNGASGISIRGAPVNIAKVEVSGIDAELAYSTELAGGTLKLRALGSYALKNSNSADAVPNGPIRIGAYGVVGGVPQWTLNLRQGFEKEVGNDQSFGFGLEERIVPAGKVNSNYLPTQFPDSQNRVPSVMFVNANFHYDFKVGSSKTQFYLTIQNLFNQDPPSVPTATSAQLPTNFELYDVLGQRFTVGLRITL
jgi:iron complex outermembrane recepter protein